MISACINIQSNCKPWLRKVSMMILALLPILAWYKIPFPVGLGYTLILFLSTYIIVRNNFKIKVVPIIFWLLFVYICLIWIYHHHFELWTLIPPG